MSFFSVAVVLVTLNTRGIDMMQCNAPGGPAGSQSHFVRWAKEIPCTELLTSKLPPTLQGLLMMPLTPQKLPPRSPLLTWIMMPSPSRTDITTQDPILSAMVSNLADRDSAVPSPSPELVDPAALSLPLELLDSVTDIENEENIPQEPAPTDPNWDNDGVLHTRVHVKKGVAITSCNGPICRMFPLKSLFATAALALLNSSVPSSVPTAPISESSAATLGISTFTAAGPDESNLNRPLQPEHYDARDQAQKAWEVRKNQLTQQKIATDALKQTITIMYWKADDSEVDVFTVPCP
ncbi:hypothetical protein K443DRAFT_13407 [Laccaria amethystina LaAM-08-1]|uniref:Uncharacterized protein n=1 Tax=Laccaria amethystina LaAM-08-1 TaxID=1095629 RepID=A0A0C9WPA7_9AGAR|nr:hypothetical protein K443DRAFT_13407 [Laccaria amethystina LaAM-08-1]